MQLAYLGPRLRTDTTCNCYNTNWNASVLKVHYVEWNNHVLVVNVWPTNMYQYYSVVCCWASQQADPICNMSASEHNFHNMSLSVFFANHDSAAEWIGIFWCSENLFVLQKNEIGNVSRRIHLCLTCVLPAGITTQAVPCIGHSYTRIAANTGRSVGFITTGTKFINSTYYLSFTESHHIILLPNSTVEYTDNNNNNDRLTAFDPGQPG